MTICNYAENHQGQKDDLLFKNSTIKKKHFNVELETIITTKNSNRLHNNQNQILIVEDNHINLKLVKLFLKECGYNNIIEASSGKSALRKFTPQLKLIILDMWLPDASGIDLLKRFRELSVKHIPILAYTALGELIKSECLSVDVDGFLFKPITFEVFKTTIQRFLCKSNNNKFK